MIGIINLANGSNNVDFDISGTNITVTLNDDEKINFENSITELTNIDISNKEWLIDSSLLSQTQDFTLNSTGITEEITLYEKGGYIDEFSVAYSPLVNLINSILSRKITLNEGNIIGWIIIKRINAANFLVETIIYDTLNEVNSIDVIFVDYTGTAPIPTEINLSNPTIINPNVKVFSMNTLTFEDPDTVIGETYNLIVDFKDNTAKSLGYVEIGLIPQNI